MAPVGSSRVPWSGLDPVLYACQKVVSTSSWSLGMGPESRPVTSAMGLEATGGGVLRVRPRESAGDQAGQSNAPMRSA